jgi:hypothetical protein
MQRHHSRNSGIDAAGDLQPRRSDCRQDSVRKALVRTHYAAPPDTAGGKPWHVPKDRLGMLRHHSHSSGIDAAGILR